jgi:DNA processing protein
MTATISSDGQRIARATLTYLAEPADPILCELLQVLSPAVAIARIRSGVLPADVTDVLGGVVATGPSLARWRGKLARLPEDAGLPGCRRQGISLICPGDPQWPPQLDDLGVARPYALWARGTGDLTSSCDRSVSIVGSRAATAYGAHVAADLASGLAGHGWTVVSGAAYGIDASAHCGDLAAGGVTVAVLACGVDLPYPAGHRALLGTIAASGLVVSEYPPGCAPTRHRFLARNRIIAALSAGTVVVEAGLRSGALNTARHARELNRPVMAVPGPVTSSQSAGCHQLIRDTGAACVTSVADVISQLASAVAGGPR